MTAGFPTLSRLRGVETPPDAKELFAIGPFGLFVIPDYDAEIACMPSCLAPGEAPRHAPTTVATYRTQRFARTAGQPAY